MTWIITAIKKFLFLDKDLDFTNTSAREGEEGREGGVMQVGFTQQETQ
jgi:hypothetical protein